MWGSSDTSAEKPSNTFNCLQHFNEILVETKVRTSPFCEIEYPEGWRDLMANFVEQISTIHCMIKKVTLSYGYLEILFTTKRLSDEAKIWRAVSECRNNSYVTCHLCGSTAMYRESAGCYQLCGHCIRTAGMNGNSGTWLDKY